MSSILGMLPGAAGKISSEDAEEGDVQMRRMESIIFSMTGRERERPDIINPSRKRRIAAGSGTRVEDVNRLLKQFGQMQKLFKQMGGKGKKGKKRMPLSALRGMGGMGGMGGGPGGFPM